MTEQTTSGETLANPFMRASGKVEQILEASQQISIEDVDLTVGRLTREKGILNEQVHQLATAFHNIEHELNVLKLKYLAVLEKHEPGHPDIKVLQPEPEQPAPAPAPASEVLAPDGSPLPTPLDGPEAAAEAPPA